MSGEEINAKILEALKNKPFGISQIGFSDATGINYGSCCKLAEREHSQGHD
jgi:hypothetical protein